MAFDTAINILSDAAIELGLASAAYSDAFGATDAMTVQLRTLLKSVGQDLVRVRDWTHLQKEKTFTTDGSGSYTLPSDFRSMIEQSGWNRSARLPLGGPLSPQEWQYASALTSASPITVLFRPGAGVLRVFQDSSGKSIAYEYRSTYWVQPSGQTAPTTDTPSANTDTIKLDRRLIICALKLAWLRSKGMPSDAAYADYAQCLDASGSDDAPAPVLSMSGSSSAYGSIGSPNVPETGFGS